MTIYHLLRWFSPSKNHRRFPSHGADTERSSSFHWSAVGLSLALGHWTIDSDLGLLHSSVCDAGLPGISPWVAPVESPVGWWLVGWYQCWGRKSLSRLVTDDLGNPSCNMVSSFFWHYFFGGAMRTWFPCPANNMLFTWYPPKQKTIWTQFLCPPTTSLKFDVLLVSYNFNI